MTLENGTSEIWRKNSSDFRHGLARALSELNKDLEKRSQAVEVRLNVWVGRLLRD
jgi:hypothetical protein